MNPKQYLKDYYSNSPNDNVLDQLSNFGSEAGGGKAAINGIVTGLTTISRNTAKGMRAGLNKVGMVADSAISKSITNEQGKDKPLTLNNIGSSIINGVGNIVKQPIKGGIYATNALNSMLASTDIAENRIKQKRDNELNSVDNFFNYK